MNVAADVVVADCGRLLLVRRAFEPWKGMWALPGGMVGEGETVEEAAVREVREETGLDVRLGGLVGVFSDPQRDPRGRVVSIAYSAVVEGGKMRGSRETTEVKWFPVTELPGLAADHSQIVREFTGYR